MLERRSALASVLSANGHDGPTGARICRIGEAKTALLIQAAGFAPTKTAFEKALVGVLGKKPPVAVGKAVAMGDTLVLRAGPEQFWISAPDENDIGERLTAAIGPEIGAVTDLSHSRTRLFIEGSAAREVLAKGIPLDLDPDIFRAGQFAQTGLHHTPVLLYRAGRDRYELWALRTFAMTVWDWLADAALLFGYDIATE